MNIAELKNQFVGDSVVLIGNGPSLSMQDLNILTEKNILSLGVIKNEKINFDRY